MNAGIPSSWLRRSLRAQLKPARDGESRHTGIPRRARKCLLASAMPSRVLATHRWPSIRSRQSSNLRRLRKAGPWQGPAQVPGRQRALATVRTCFEGPFGELLRATGPMAKANPFRFSTKFQDDETDLIYYGYRYYSARVGKWLNTDPVGEKGGCNLYSFVLNWSTTIISGH
jgi:RHS repeat-associated protein